MIVALVMYMCSTHVVVVILSLQQNCSCELMQVHVASLIERAEGGDWGEGALTYTFMGTQIK